MPKVEVIRRGYLQCVGHAGGHLRVHARWEDGQGLGVAEEYMELTPVSAFVGQNIDGEGAVAPYARSGGYNCTERGVAV